MKGADIPREQMEAGWEAEEDRLYERDRQRRRLMDGLTDVMARILYYQEHGEPDLTQATYKQALEETQQLPPHILNRYRCDQRFHAQVTRAVALTLQCIADKSPEKQA